MLEIGIGLQSRQRSAALDCRSARVGPSIGAESWSYINSVATKPAKLHDTTRAISSSARSFCAGAAVIQSGRRHDCDGLVLPVPFAGVLAAPGEIDPRAWRQRAGLQRRDVSDGKARTGWQ